MTISEYRKENFQIWEFENEDNADREVTLYKEDIRWIKKVVPAKAERAVDCRRLLLVLIYICRKCNTDTVTIYHNRNNRITKSSLCRLADTDRRYFDTDIKLLTGLGLLSLSVDKKNRLLINMVQVNNNGCEVLASGISYKKLTGIVRAKIREKIVSSAKNDCA